MVRHFGALVGGLMIALSLTVGAEAAGGGGSSGGTGGGGSTVPPTPTCVQGKVWDPARKMCVVKSSELPDSALTDYAFALAKADRFQEALETLDLVKNQTTPQVLNYRGYITRKLGRTDEGIGYYLKSVELDPTYVQVREYLGEAYVIKGRFDLAQEQLKVIGAVCGKDCEEYQDLAKAIASGTIEN